METSKYRKLLEQDPDDSSALRALCEEAAAKNNWPQLAEFLSREAALCENAGEKSDLLLRAGKVKRDNLENPGEALADFQAALHANPESRAAREEQWMTLIRLEKWADLANSLLEAANSLNETNPRHSKALRLVRAEIYEFMLNDPDGAEAACAETEALNGGRLAHVINMEIRAKQGRWADLEESVRELADSATSGAEKAAWEWLRAHLLECRLDKPAEADAVLDKLLTGTAEDEPLQPWRSMAMLARADLNFVLENHSGMAEALKMLVEFCKNQETPSPAPWRAAMLNKQGEILQSALEDKSAALAKFAMAHEIEPTNPRYIRAMLRLQVGVDNEALLESQKALLAQVSGAGLSSAVATFAGRALNLSLGRREEALELYRKARQLTGDSSPSLQIHLALIEGETLRNLGRYEELSELWAELAGTVSDDKVKAALLVELSQIFQHRLNLPDRAAESLRQALAIPATALGMVRAMAQAYADMEDMENLVMAVAGQERLAQAPDYLVHLGLVAADLWQRLGRSDQAFKALSSVIKLDADNMEALLMLENICYEQNSDQNLYGVQQRLLDLLDKETDGAFIQALRLDHASLLLYGMNNEDAGLPILQQALVASPGEPAALMELRLLAYRGDRWEEYVETARNEADSAGRHPSLLYRAALAAWGRLDRIDDAVELLKEIEAQGAHTATLLETVKMLRLISGSWMPWLASAAALAPLLDEQGRVLLFFEMARVHRWRLKSLDTAAECYDRMVELEPDNYMAHESQCLLNLQTGKTENLKKVHAALISMEQDDLKQAMCRFRRADLAEQAGEWRQAETDYKAVASVLPDDVAVLRRLERLYAATDNAPAQIEILRKEIKLRSDRRMLILLLMRQGALWERLQNADEAIACYRETLAQNPDELDALNGLTRLYTQEQKWRELQENLERHAAVTPDASQKIELLKQRALVWEQRLGDLKPAIKSHVAALKVDQNHIPSLRELERLYEAMQRWEEELSVLGRLLDLATDEEEQHRIHFKMGGIYEEKMAAPTAAINSFVKALEIKSDHLRSLDSLERLYDQMGDAARLIPILEKKASLLPEEQVRLFIWVGRLWDEKLSDPQKAIASYERVLSVDAKNLETLDALKSLYEGTEQWENAIRSVMMKAEAVDEPGQAVKLYNSAGAMWIEKFQNDEKGLESYSKALSINPRHRPSLAKIREIYSRMGRWEEVVSSYSREVEFTTESAAKAALLTAMGNVLEREIKNDARASQQYEMALRSDPNHQDAIRPLARIYFNHQRWEQADPLYRKWAEAIGENEPVDEVAQVYYERGRVLQGLSQDREALIYYRHSIEKKPDYLEPQRARSDLHIQRQEWSEALESEQNVLELLEARGDASGAADSLRRMGEFAVKAGQTDDAINYFNTALERGGENAAMLESLVELHSEKELWNTVKGIYDRLIAIHKDSPEEAPYRLRKGIVLEDKIGENQNAFNEYTRALELSPDYIEALHRQAGALIKMLRWDDAASASERLLSLVKEPHQVADAHCLLGSIEQKGRKNLAAARQAYEKALEIEPTHLGAMDSIGDILEAMEDWNGYVATFEKFLKNIPPSAMERTHDIHIRLGQVYRDQLKNRDKAIIEFNNAVKANASSEPAHAALAKLYLENKSYYPQAIRENQLILKTNAFFEDAYRDLSKIYEEQREPDKAFCVYGALSLFGALGKWDRTNFEARLEHLPAHTDKVIDDVTRDNALLHPMARHPATVLMSALSASICKIMPAGSPPGQRLPDSHPARKMAAEIANNLGVEAYEIFQGNEVSLGVTWFPSSPPSFALNTRIFDSASERGKRFMVGRGLEGVKNGLAAFYGLGEAEAKKRLQIITKLFKPEVVVAGINDRDAVGLAKALKKDVPRKVRKSLEEAATAHHVQERQFGFQSWQTGLVHSANRGGLVVSGHPAEALHALLLTEKKLKPSDKPTVEIMKSSGQIMELLRFIVNDQYFIARKRSGMSLY